MDNNFKLNMKRTWKYIRKSGPNLFLYVIASVIEAVISAIIPLFATKIILNITDGAINQLLMSSFVVFFIELVLFVMYYLKGSFYQKIYLKTLINIQKSLAGEILNLEVEEIDKNTTGLFIDRLNKDTQDIAGLFMEYTYWISYIITNIGVLVTIFILNKFSICIYFYMLFSLIYPAK